MKILNTVKILFTVLLLSSPVYGQNEPHSGILHSSSNTEQFNLLKIHCNAVSIIEIEGLIRKEFAKYVTIKSVDIRVNESKIYIKHTNEIDANMILGILERVNVYAFYQDTDGNPVVFQKTGTENFIR